MAALLVSVVLLPGCGVTDGLDRFQETIDETLDEPEPLSTPAVGTAVDDSLGTKWTEYAAESGIYSVDLPAEPEYEGLELDGLPVGGWLVESKSDGFGIGEYDVGFGKSYDLDLGVIRAIEAAVSSIEEQFGRSATYDVVEQRFETRDGHEGVRFVAAVALVNKPYATVHGAVYNADGTVVFVTMTDTDSDNPADAERFIDSLELSP